MFVRELKSTIQSRNRRQSSIWYFQWMSKQRVYFLYRIFILNSNVASTEINSLMIQNLFLKYLRDMHYLVFWNLERLYIPCSVGPVRSSTKVRVLVLLLGTIVFCRFLLSETPSLSDSLDQRFRHLCLYLMAVIINFRNHS